jgi:hypothetical protein
MLSGIRSIAIKDNIVLGGNLRLKALKTILDTPIDELAKIIADNTKDKSESRISFLIDYWTDFKENKEFNFIIADNLTDMQAKEFLIKDNVNIANFDMDMLANEWDSEILADWGVNVWVAEEEKEESEKEKENEYTQKIDAPIYEPKNEKPDIVVLYDSERYKQLIIDIENSSVPENIKTFLKVAASRHIVFNYENIADFYSHSDEETQCLMEDSALVIIDFNKAIEKGYVKLTEEIKEQYLGEYPND